MSNRNRLDPESERYADAALDKGNDFTILAALIGTKIIVAAQEDDLPSFLECRAELQAACNDESLFVDLWAATTANCIGSGYTTLIDLMIKAVDRETPAGDVSQLEESVVELRLALARLEAFARAGGYASAARLQQKKDGDEQARNN